MSAMDHDRRRPAGGGRARAEPEQAAAAAGRGAAAGGGGPGGAAAAGGGPSAASGGGDPDDSGSLGVAWLETVRERFGQQRELAEQAAARVPDALFFEALGPGENSLGILMKHMAGNLRSRWREFLTSDGEKPDRRRDAEFEVEPEDTRASIEAAWEEGWRIALGTLGSLEPVDLLANVRLRGEPLTVVAAIERQLAHAAYHTGQIVFLAKHLTGERWDSLSIPRGESQAFTERTLREHGHEG